MPTTFKRTRTSKTGKKIVETVTRKSGKGKIGKSSKYMGAEYWAKQDAENQKEAYKELKSMGHPSTQGGFSEAADYAKHHSSLMSKPVGYKGKNKGQLREAVYYNQGKAAPYMKNKNYTVVQKPDGAYHVKLKGAFEPSQSKGKGKSNSYKTYMHSVTSGHKSDSGKMSKGKAGKWANSRPGYKNFQGRTGM